MNNMTNEIVAIKAEVRERKWKELSMECQQSGLSVKDWCRQNGIHPSTYYARLRKLREKVCRDIVAIESEAQPIQLSEIKITSGEIVIEKHTRKAKRTHEEAFEHLPVEEVIHEAENKICEKCGKEMLVIGKERVRDELVYVPARIFVRRHFAEVIKCSSYGSDETRDAQLSDIEACTIRQAFVPAPVIPHSYCSPELLAHIVYEKYCNAVPLERQAMDLAAQGVKNAMKYLILSDNGRIFLRKNACKNDRNF